MKTRFLIELTVMALLTSGCTSVNYIAARQFSETTEKLNTATTELVDVMYKQCLLTSKFTHDTYEYMVVASTASLNSCNRNNLDSLTLEACNKLKNYKTGDPLNCKARSPSNIAASGLNLAIKDFGSAVKDLANDKFVQTTENKESIQSILDAANTLSEKTKSDFKLEDKEIKAASSIANFVVKLMLEGARQNKVKEAFSKKNIADLKVISAALRSIGKKYEDDLKNNRTTVTSTLTLLESNISPGVATSEPIARMIESRKAREVEKQIEDATNMVVQYQKTMDSFDKALDQTAKDINHPKRDEILSGIRDFYTEVRKLNDLISEAK